MRRLVIFLFVLLALSTPMFGLEQGVLYQTSTIDALLAGQYDGICTLAELKKHGDFGIGTFNELDGEMLLLNGCFYRVSSDGKARQVVNDTTPFAAVTFFSPTLTASIDAETDMKALTQRIDSLLLSKNLFCAIRIDGRFQYIKTRSVPRQSKPYPKLTDVVTHQPTFEMSEVNGTIVGLYCPYFVKGVNVPGYHLHFITQDKKRGGHLLDCRLSKGTVVLDCTPGFMLMLPTNGDFLKADLQTGAAGDVDKVEKGK